MKKVLLKNSIISCIILVVALQLYAGKACSQIITTIAGGGSNSSDNNIPATTALFHNVQYITADSIGDIYISDNIEQRVFKVNTSGTITYFAGNGTSGYIDNVQATAAELHNPNGIAVDKTGNVYIADGFNNRIRKVDPSGNITTFAGTGTAGDNGDNAAATTVQLHDLYGLATDRNGNLYVGEVSNSFTGHIRKITPSGFITTMISGSVSGLNLIPNNLTVDTSGNVYFNEGNYYIYKVTPAGVSSLFYTYASSGSGAGISVDNMGNFYACDGNRVVKITPAGIASTFAGTGTAGTSGDGGPATAAKLQSPPDVTHDGIGNVYISDENSYHVRRVSPPASITVDTVSGNPFCAGDTVTVPFTIHGVFNAGNVFTAQLSNATGSFANPVNIGTDVASTAGTIHATIPANTPGGTNYHIRIVGNSPLDTSINYDSAIIIKAAVIPSATIAASDTTVCPGTQIIFTSTPTNGGANPDYQWFKNNLFAGNGNTYTDASPTNGDAVYCVLTSNAMCALPDTAHSDTITVTVNALPTAGTLSGPATVCPGTGAAITLTTTVSGGSWSSTSNTATVLGGTVTGILAGLDTIRYIVTNTCGSDTARHAITVNAAPDAGSISGAATVCVGTATTLTNTVSGGTWATVNNDVTLSGGVATGVAAGVDTVLYMVTNVCGTDTATHAITVTPNANAGTISGVSQVCTGASITLTDAAPGGIWSSTNNKATISAGVVTGISAGIDTILYVVTNTCGVDTAKYPIIVNSVPTAGTISGPSTVCPASMDTLNSTITGGTWSVANGNASVSNNGIVSGISAGTDTILYIVSATCGADTAMQIMTVNPTVAPSITIAADTNTICAGTLIIFSTQITNGGAIPFYQWILNGAHVGTNSPSYSNATLNNNDVITCQLLSNATCVSPTTVTSNSITMTVNPGLSPAVHISATDTVICTSIPVTFTATPTNGGTTPTYKWEKNGNVVDTGNSYTDASLNNNDVIVCVLTSNAFCAITPTVNSNVITMTVNQPVAPTIAISTTNTTICSGTAVTFIANETNGGSTPVYNWTKNGGPAGSNSSSYTDNSLNNNDHIACTLTSNASCLSSATASDTIQMTVNPSITPVVNIHTNPGDTICYGIPVAFTATSINAGHNAVYEWTKNGILAANGNTYTGTGLADGDLIVCTLLSDTTCATPAIVKDSVEMTVHPIPQPVVVVDSLTFSTSSYSSYQWFRNDTAIPGATSQSYTITQDGSYNVTITDNIGCMSTSLTDSINGPLYPQDVPGVTENKENIRFYPNPSNNIVYIESPVSVSADLSSVDGKLVLHQDNATTIDMGNLPSGMYVITLYDKARKVIKIAKLVKD